MDNSKKFLKDHNILPKISFKDMNAHKVVLVQDKEVVISGGQGRADKPGIRYKVLEDNVPKIFETASEMLISKLSEMEENTEVVIQMKSRKTPDGFKNYFEVNIAGNIDDIPSEENNEGEQNISDEIKTDEIPF